jgi:lycopene cyclase CruP
MNQTETIFGTIPGNTLNNLRKADQAWDNLKTGNIPIPEVVKTASNQLDNLEYDVIIAGGTLGILIAAALQKQGWKIALIERGILRGRDQEWNLSREELKIFLDRELLTETELKTAIVTEYNPARVSFHEGYELWVEDVLNIGIDPVFLLETLKSKFLEMGGILLENTPFQNLTIYDNGILVETGEKQLTARLFIDGMGHFSPIAQQVRQGKKPDGVCLVVGSCAKGYPENKTGDLIVSFTEIEHQCQYFWEAFPAKDGRTTYLFTYVDADRDRFSLEFLMEEYFRLLPEYQNIALSELKFERFLFGFFPSYRNSPLKLRWDRMVAIGDSSGSQSPVSFGGFGAMVRHLKRLSRGINEALVVDCLDQKALAKLQPYQPNISVTWLFQKTMSVGVGQKYSPQQINRLMSGVFRVMDRLGDDVVNPFLKDVIQFFPLTKTLLLVNPILVVPLLPNIGIIILLDWLIHYLNLALYTALFSLGKLGDKLINLSNLIQQLSPIQQYYFHRWLDAWEYGSGNDQ